MKKKTYNKKRKISPQRKRKILDNNIEPKFEDDDLMYDEYDDSYSNQEIEDEEIEDEEIEDEEEEEDIQEKIQEKIKEKPKKGTDKTRYYVDPKEFDEEIMKYYKSGILTNEIAEMISKISNKLSFAGNFINYSYREEMVGDGIIRMMKALIAKKYSREKGTNPFSYFTRIAFNAFRNRIKKEKHIHETHEKYQREFMLMSESFNHLSKNNNINIMKERDRER
jgi:DNA-directed RNA polymerase specialized sigma24 family protein